MSNIIKITNITDVHVHLRVPGGEHKEDLSWGTKAAVAGGVTRVLAMPNTSPPITDLKSLENLKKIAKNELFCDVGFFLGATNENFVLPDEQKAQFIGLKMYVNDTYGDLRIEDMNVVKEHFKRWHHKNPIAVHAEGDFIPKIIQIAKETQRSVHFCHISTKDDIIAIKKAKSLNLKVTSEVTPHHLFLTNKDFESMGAYAYVKPELKSFDDVAALWENLEFIDVIATDHAPHTKFEKESKNPPPGLPGVQTMLPLMLTAVNAGRLSMQRLIEMISINPAKIYNLPLDGKSYTEVDLSCKYKISDAELFYKCAWTPYKNFNVQGKIIKTVINGSEVFNNSGFLGEIKNGRVL